MCVCILALVIRHANRIISAQHHIVTRGLSGLQYFSILSHKGTVVGKKVLNMQCVCVDVLYNFCSKHFSFEEDVSEILS